jgi:DNA-binding response OmpR family regulator
MNQSILVIEDSRAQAKLVETLLISIGCAPTLAMSGAEAREKFGSIKFDMILLDMVLPDASGIQLLNEIRKAPTNADATVIILSGVTDKGNIVDALHLGAHDYITKPYHQAEFLNRVQTHLNYQQTIKYLKEALEQCASSAAKQ